MTQNIAPPLNYKKNDLVVEKNTVVKPGFLPQGDFIYPITIINPLGIEWHLQISIFSGGSLLHTSAINFSDIKYCYDFHFSIEDIPGAINTNILISIKGHSTISINLPVSPKKLKTKGDLLHDWKETEDEINNEIQDWEDESKINSSYLQQYAAPNTGIAMNKKQIDSHISSRYFRGLLKKEDALAQMDFVVYNKMFAPDGSKGFRKWKRARYRGILILLYKALTKNSARKLYFAKIYRNYVNNNLLSENIHGQ